MLTVIYSCKYLYSFMKLGFTRRFFTAVYGLAWDKTGTFNRNSILVLASGGIPTSLEVFLWSKTMLVLNEMSDPVIPIILGRNPGQDCRGSLHVGFILRPALSVFWHTVGMRRLPKRVAQLKRRRPVRRFRTNRPCSASHEPWFVRVLRCLDNRRSDLFPTVDSCGLYEEGNPDKQWHTIFGECFATHVVSCRGLCLPVSTDAAVCGGNSTYVVGMFWTNSRALCHRSRHVRKNMISCVYTTNVDSPILCTQSGRFYCKTTADPGGVGV